jgi:protein-S-isoprenylcysteine O-methyltransferase Ste14
LNDEGTGGEATTAATKGLRQKLTPAQRAMVWAVRLVLLCLLYKFIRNRSIGDPWPLLRSRTFPALVLWVTFFVYWSIAGRNSAPTKTSESKASSYFHQIVLSGALLLLFFPVRGLTAAFLPQTLLFVVVGAIVQAAFMVLAIWARRHLGRNWSAEVRIGEAHELVRTGPYRRLRHPIYTAMLGMFAGTTIASGQYHALVGVAVLIVAYLRKTRLEEEILRKTFGADFEAYYRDSWALVPYVF